MVIKLKRKSLIETVPVRNSRQGLLSWAVLKSVQINVLSELYWNCTIWSMDILTLSWTLPYNCRTVQNHIFSELFCSAVQNQSLNCTCSTGTVPITFSLNCTAVPNWIAMSLDCTEYWRLYKIVFILNCTCGTLPNRISFWTVLYRLHVSELYYIPSSELDCKLSHMEQ